MNRKWWFAAGLLVIWQAGAILVDNSQIMPGIPAVLSALNKELLGGGLLLPTLYTLIVILAGLALSLACALMLAMFASRHAGVRDGIKWLSGIFHPLPGIAILPILIVWFGIGYEAILVLILHSVLWPILVNLLAAIDTFPPTLIKVGDNYDLSMTRRFLYLTLPGIMPSLIAGLKTGWARAFRAAISAEMFFGAIGSTGGLGWFLVKKRVFLDTTGLFAGLVIIALVGILFENVVLRELERRTLKRWGMQP